MTDDHDAPITHNGIAERVAVGCAITAAILVGIAIWIGVAT